MVPAFVGPDSVFVSGTRRGGVFAEIELVLGVETLWLVIEDILSFSE